VRRFFLITFGLVFVSNFGCWFAGNSLLDRLAAPEIGHWLLGIFVLLQVIGLAAMLVARALGFQPGTGMALPLLVLVMIWNLLLALPTAMASWLWLTIWWVASAGGTGADSTSPGREIGLLAVAAPFVAAFLATALAVWQLQRFRVRRLTLEIPNLPPALQGFTIAHLSDLHIGLLTRGRVLEDLVMATNLLTPDLILLTGDLINFSLEDLPRGLEILHQMKSRYGLYLCEGNHDLIQSRSEFEAATKASGLSLLLNEGATISVHGHAVRILGLRWGEGMEGAEKTAGAAPVDVLSRLLAEGQPGAFTILLAHHPQVFDAAARAGIPLTLAGHTHGGQLMLTPGIGFGPWLYRYWSGLYRRGASQLVVSNGAGNWFPLRLGAPAEIIHLTLESAGSVG